MKIASIVGARPQFIKLGPLIRAIIEVKKDSCFAHTIVHTGQHYDTDMSDVFFDQLNIPQPDYNLEVGSGPHGQQTGRMLEKIEQALLEICPDMVLVYGDTNSTLAGALAASKLHIPVAHIEAGLRSFNRKMPEEINRIAADHLSDLLLVPTPNGMENLEYEGLAEKSVFVGDLMYQAVIQNREIAAIQSKILTHFGLLDGSYGLVTIHRAENTDNQNRLRDLSMVLNRIAATDVPLIFPMHPRTERQLKKLCPDWVAHQHLILTTPLGYLDMLVLLQNARMVLTDSGGLQKEAFFSNCPCITLREETEWSETVAAGGNLLAGTDPQVIETSVAHWKQIYPHGHADFSAGVHDFFGAGDVASKILQALTNFFRQYTVI